MEKPWKQRPQSLTDKAGTPATSVPRPKAWQRWISFPGKVDLLPRVAGSSKTPHASHQGPFRTHLQFLTSQGCRFILCLCFATPLGHEGHGTGPEEGEGGQLGLGAHSMELHEVLQKGERGGYRRQGTGTSKCSQSAEEPRYGFNLHLSRYQTSATKEVPLNRQKRAP